MCCFRLFTLPQRVHLKRCTLLPSSINFSICSSSCCLLPGNQNSSNRTRTEQNNQNNQMGPAAVYSHRFYPELYWHRIWAWILRFVSTFHVNMKSVLWFENRLANTTTIIARKVMVLNVIDNVVLSGTDLSTHHALEHVLVQPLDASCYVFPIPWNEQRWENFLFGVYSNWLGTKWVLFTWTCRELWELNSFWQNWQG